MKNKTKKQPGLIKVFVLKEKAWWKRTIQMRKKFSGLGRIIGFPLAFILIFLGHISFAFMHFSFECFLWVVNRSHYRVNMRKLYAQVS